MRTPPPLPEEDPRYEPEEPISDSVEPKPGMFPDAKTAAERFGLYVGLGLFTWALLLGALWVTVKVVQSLL